MNVIWLRRCKSSLFSNLYILYDDTSCLRGFNFVAASTQVVLTVQQKPVAATSAVTVTGTATATATTASGLQVGIVGAAASQQHQRPVSLSAAGNMSPSQATISLHRASTAPAGSASCNARITGPQPVDVSRRACPVLSVSFNHKREKPRAIVKEYYGIELGTERTLFMRYINWRYFDSNYKCM